MDRKSDLDETVRKIRTDTNHRWEAIDGVEYCIRCGRAKGMCGLHEPPYWTKCPGIVL